MNSGLGDFVDLEVRWHDGTSHGSSLSYRLHHTVRQVLHPRCWEMLASEMRKDRRRRKRFDSDALCQIVREERNSEAYQAVVHDPSFWRPDPAHIQPASFRLQSEEGSTHLTLPVAWNGCRAVGEWLRTGETENVAVASLQRSLDTAIGRASFNRVTIAASDRGPLLVGHGCVTWSDGEVRLWTDPFLRPKRLRYPLGQQPISPLDTPEAKHVVAITHSHPDHFSPASLLLFPPDTTIVVPRVDHETLLTVDLALRVRQLGFDDVRALGWGEQVSIGRFVITALPFYGEQALGPHAEVALPDRNHGSTYHVAGPHGLTAMFLADAGADPTGSSLQLAREVRGTLGRVDFLFGNHRRWRVHPPQHLTTSVPQNICFVPDAELGVPQATMLTPEELEVIGTVLSARSIAPYAMGGAPWFGEIGLGPTGESDGSIGSFDAHVDEILTSDDPDTLVTATPRLVALTPGDGIDAQGLWRERGLEPIDSSAFPPPPSPSSASGRSMAIGGRWDQQGVQDLLLLTRIDPSAYLVAAPGFVEIVTADGEAAELLWELAGRLVLDHEWICWSATPLTGGLFRADPAWLDMFERAHRRSSHALRDGDQAIAEIGAVVDQLRGTVPSTALETIAGELLGITIRVAPPTAASGGELAPAGRLDLPPAAAPLIETYGQDAVTRALLVIKLIHNIVLTARAVGYPGLADETALFSTLLGRRQECGSAT